MITELCFVRHGETEWNNQRRIQGTINNPLNENGRKQAVSVGTYFKTHDPNWDLIASSSLDRAYETAQIIAQKIGYNKEIIKTPLLREREFGKAEGEGISKEIFDRIIADEIEDMEKNVDLQNRVYNFVKEIAKKYKGKRILLVTHSHVIKGLLTKLDNKYSFHDEMVNSALNYFTVKNDEISIDKINISVHL